MRRNALSATIVACSVALSLGALGCSQSPSSNPAAGQGETAAQDSSSGEATEAEDSSTDSESWDSPAARRYAALTPAERPSDLSGTWVGCAATGENGASMIGSDGELVTFDDLKVFEGEEFEQFCQQQFKMSGAEYLTLELRSDGYVTGLMGGIEQEIEGDDRFDRRWSSTPDGGVEITIDGKPDSSFSYVPELNMIVFGFIDDDPDSETPTYWLYYLKHV